MPPRRAIGERLRRAKTLVVKHEVASDWAANWRRDHDDLVEQLEAAVRAMDYDALCQVTGQIKAVGAKGHGALPTVLDALATEDDA